MLKNIIKKNRKKCKATQLVEDPHRLRDLRIVPQDPHVEEQLAKLLGIDRTRGVGVVL
jgi:5'(3')-deoxyribonucleotidase